MLLVNKISRIETSLGVSDPKTNTLKQESQSQHHLGTYEKCKSIRYNSKSSEFKDSRVKPPEVCV